MHNPEPELNLRADVAPALSLRQPWAWLVVHGGKTIENRTWGTRYRGPLFIHAALGMGHQEWVSAVTYVRQFDPALASRIPNSGQLIRGHLIGLVTLDDVIAPSDVLEVEVGRTVSENELERWYDGSYGFVFRDAVPIEPVPLRGMQRIFAVPKTLEVRRAR